MEYQELLKMKERIVDVFDERPLLAIVLGSGLSYLQEYMAVEAELEYASIPGHPVCTNKSHRGRYLFGRIENVPAVILDGRFHYYEGYSAFECTIPERLLAMLGVRHLILTNAVGGITAGPGTVLVNTDQIACFMPSPLRGKNLDEIGERFPDMSEVYDPRIAKAIVDKAGKEGLPCQSGVFLQLAGPQFETKAEIRMARILGADSVGMSTGIEAIASRHAGIRNVGLSLVTNWACGLAEGPISDEEVVLTARQSEKTMRRVFEIALEAIFNDR